MPFALLLWLSYIALDTRVQVHCFFFLLHWVYIYIYRNAGFPIKVDRIDLGEECNYHLASDILAEAIKAWNQSVDRLRELMADKETFLSLLEKNLDMIEVDGQSADAFLAQATENVKNKLLNIDLKPTHQNFLSLRYGFGDHFVMFASVCY